MRPPTATALALVALAVTGCAARTPTPPTTPAAAPPVAAPAAPPTLGGPPVRVLDLPGVPGQGAPREVRALVDEPVVKVATIVLRGGTVLPEHHAAVPVTIVALQGAGHVVAAGERLRLDATHAVVLAPGVPHAVEPDAGVDLVLLVHHLGRAAGEHAAH